MNNNLELLGLTPTSHDIDIAHLLNSPTAEGSSFTNRRSKTCDSLDKSCEITPGNRSMSKLDKTGDDFWAALQSHYNYLMDDGLIATCKEANGELSWDDEDLDESITWSFTEFIEQYSKLFSWLELLHISVSKDNVDSTASHLSRAEEMKSKICLRTTFNDQSMKLVKRYPNMKDEIINRVAVLNEKWEAFEKVMIPADEISNHDMLLKDVSSKVKCLRRWLHLLEAKIQQLGIHPEWDLQTMQQKLAESEVLQKELESYRSFISSVIKLFDSLCSGPNTASLTGVCSISKDIPKTKGGSADNKCRCKHLRRVATNLEHRLHIAWLKFLEWHYLLEEVISKCKAGRVRSDGSLELSFGLDEPLTKVPRLGSSFYSNSNQSPNTSFSSDRFNSTANENDQSNFDINKEEINSDCIADVIENPRNLPSLPNSTNMVGTDLKGSKMGGPTKLEIIHDVGYSSESSAYISNDCADNKHASGNFDVMKGGMLDSGICTNHNSDENLMHSTPKTIELKGHRRVKDWLKKQDGEPAHSSCDASGEYTSNDDVGSDTSEDLNSSVVTCKQRSASVGSNMDADNGQSAELAGKGDGVVRRKKRRNRDRPWSVTELYQMSSQLDLSPFSTSETALNDISPICSSPLVEKSNSTSHVSKCSSNLERSGSSSNVNRKKTRSRRRKTDSGSDSFSSNYGSANSRSSKSPSVKISSSIEKFQSETFGAGVVSSDTDNDYDKFDSKQIVKGITPLVKNILTIDDAGNFSDQVWDGYQDPPYFSEACSEFTVDDNTLKQLMDFGDDYRAFIGSQSDTVSLLSNQSIRKGRSKSNSSRLKLQPRKVEFNSDSDSDLEDLNHVIKESLGQLQISESMIRKYHEKQAFGMSNNSLNYAELEATCQTNLKCWQVIERHLDAAGFNINEKPVAQGLIQRWENISDEAMKLRCHDEQVKRLFSTVDEYHSKMEYLSASIAVKSISNFEELSYWINKHQLTLTEIQEIKFELLGVSSDIHKTASMSSNLPLSLKNQLTSVYQSCEELYERCGNQLTELQTTKSRWQDFLNQFEKLQSRLDKLQTPTLKHDLSFNVDEIKEELSWLRRHVSQESLSSDCDSGIGLWDGASNLLQDVENQIDSLFCGSISNHANDSSSDSEEMTTRCLQDSHQSFCSYMWRVFKGALPFQAAFILLCCLAWILEPRCCDFSNSYFTSFYPQVRYGRGPPPV